MLSPIFTRYNWSTRKACPSAPRSTNSSWFSFWKTSRITVDNKVIPRELLAKNLPDISMVCPLKKLDKWRIKECHGLSCTSVLIIPSILATTPKNCQILISHVIPSGNNLISNSLKYTVSLCVFYQSWIGLTKIQTSALMKHCGIILTEQKVDNLQRRAL